MKKISIALIMLSAWAYYSSCSKNDDLQNPDPGTIDSVDIMGFRDSTLLIKSLHRVDYNGDGTFRDSSTSYISYDTVNRKIVISDEKGNETEEHIYNNKGLLIHLLGKEDDGSDYKTDYTYDESNILKSVNESYGTNNETYTLNKILLPSGNYQLKWEEPSDPSEPNRHEYFLANFDSKSNTLSYYDYINSQLYIFDSVLYDAAGSISKVIRTLHKATQTNPNNTVTFTQFDFVSRDTKGDQLYNFYRILYNGVSNFPDLYSGFGGPFTETFFQFLKYPVLTTNITNPNPDDDSFTTVSFNETPQYDSKNRLIKFKTFFNDVELYVTEYTISYYK